MAETCKNCNEIIAQNFCANCGQKKYKRIDKKYVFDELQYTFIHANKGFFYSIKNILKYRGKTARDFIEGDRVNHYKPIVLAFMLASISTFLTYKVLGFGEVINKQFAKQPNGKVINEIMAFIANYNAIFMMMLIPLFAITTKIAFRKWGHNYYEHVILNAFFMSFNTLASLVIIYPILYVLSKMNGGEIILKFSQYAIMLSLILLGIFFKGIYYEKPTKAIVLRVLASVGLTLLGYIILIIIVTIGAGIYMAIFNPQALKTMQPH